MKRRFIALFLALMLLCLSLSRSRGYAAVTGTVVAIASIGTFAFSVLMLITSGEAENIAEDVSDWIEDTAAPGMEIAFTGDGSWLATGYNQIFQTVKSWFNSGELTIEDGRINLTYSQYLELYSQVITVAAKPDVEFDAGYLCSFLSADLSLIPVVSLPRINQYFESADGQAYCPVYYNDEQMIFADYFTTLNSYYNNGSVYSTWQCFYFLSPFSQSSLILRGGWADFEYIKNEKPAVYMPDLSTFKYSFEYYGSHYATHQSTHCFVFSNGELTYMPISEVDVSGMTAGLITTTGKFGDFLKSLHGYNSSVTVPDNLTDLSDVLPTEYNPSLSFPETPDMSIALENQVIIGDIPGVPDTALSEYTKKTSLDVDVPSVIINKFPFCIPFDFVRILGVLCADPVAPVFRVPISTNPDNLGDFAENQTIGEYLNGQHLFEIDEEIVIDLSNIPLLQGVSYTVFIVGFVILLIKITPNMINH